MSSQEQHLHLPSMAELLQALKTGRTSTHLQSQSPASWSHGPTRVKPKRGRKVAFKIKRQSYLKMADTIAQHLIEERDAVPNWLWKSLRKYGPVKMNCSDPKLRYLVQHDTNKNTTVLVFWLKKDHLNKPTEIICTAEEVLFTRQSSR